MDQGPKHKKKNETMQVPEENRGELFFHLNLRKGFLTPTQNT